MRTASSVRAVTAAFASSGRRLQTLFRRAITSRIGRHEAALSSVLSHGFDLKRLVQSKNHYLSQGVAHEHRQILGFSSRSLNPIGIHKSYLLRAPFRVFLSGLGLGARPPGKRYVVMSYAAAPCLRDDFPRSGGLEVSKLLFSQISGCAASRTSSRRVLRW